ncbi:MAG: hypothetical protein R2940_12395 [Syntrophotaleaceae bacterium]
MPKGTFIEYDLLESAAYRQLTATARDVFHRFLKKRQLKKRKGSKKNEWIVANNGEIIFPYSEAEKMEISRATFARCLDSLIECGFIDIEHSGGGGPGKDVSLYGLSERWRKHGTPEFEKRVRPKDTRQGEALERYHREKKR